MFDFYIEKIVRVIKWIMMCVIIPLMGLLFVCYREVKSDKKVYDRVEEKLDSGYSLFLDGNKTDPKQVYIGLYDTFNIHIDDERKAVFVTIGKGRDKIEFCD